MASMDLHRRELVQGDMPELGQNVQSEQVQVTGTAHSLNWEAFDLA